MTWVQITAFRVSLLLWLGAVTIAAAQAPPTSAAPELQPRDAVQLLRRLNTTQATLARAGAARYGDLEAVLRQDTTLSGAVTPINGISASVKGYTLTLISAVDGRGYRASLTSATPCALAFFSDEGGLIYTGRALDCPAK
jgi:hypothetical protein